MSPNRILIVNIRSLLIEGVERLLKANQEFVVANTFASDPAALIFEIEELKPDIVILDDVTTFVEPAQLIASLLNTQNMRLIVVNYSDNTINIFDKRECTISNSDQFIAAISPKDSSVNSL